MSNDIQFHELRIIEFLDGDIAALDLEAERYGYFPDEWFIDEELEKEYFRMRKEAYKYRCELRKNAVWRIKINNYTDD